jgi:hypothetical protein
MNWEGFLDSIQRGKVIPIVGNDLCLIEDASGNLMQLDYYIAQELIERLGVGVAGDTLYDLALYNGRPKIIQTIDDIIEDIQSNKDGKHFYAKPLEDLVQITDFNFFISTTFDNRLEKILNLKRSDQVNKIINYSIYSNNGIPEKADNVVFNLLGSMSSGIQYALTEDEILEHFYSLAYNYNTKGEQSISKYFFDRIKGKTLLLIGCSYPDWFMRFIIRALANESYQRKSYVDYIADNCTHNDVKLSRFLKFFKSEIVVLEGEDGNDENVRVKNAVAFINKLHAEWVKVNANKVPIKYDGTVFISYNNQDLQQAKVIRNHIRAAGINVWFDEENLSSGQHRPYIESEIKKCKVFLPVVSDNVLNKPESYSQEVEWKTAKKRFEFDTFYEQNTFSILPTFIDDTLRNDHRLPEFLRLFANFHVNQMDFVIQQIKQRLTTSQN